jgi:hypothetical protein
VIPRHKRIFAVIILIEVILAAAAWRDLATRTDDQIRGNRRLWRMFVLLNPGNSLFYWLLGRRAAPRLKQTDRWTAVRRSRKITAGAGW